MRKRKVFPYKVISTVFLSAMLLSTTVFAESYDNGTDSTSDVSQPNIADILKKGFADEQNQDTGDYSNVYSKENQLTNQFQPNEKVRIIVEVESPDVSTTASEETKEKKFKEKQDQVINKLNKTKDKPHVKHRFFKGLNGFSMETEYKNVKDIQNEQGVKNVHIARVFQPSMAASKELVQAQKVWEQYGYKGEGLVVGVVDSGIDWTHKDMTITDKGKQQEKWTNENIKGKFEETDVNDIWYSDKVPTGYDWADNDTDVVPRGTTGNPHGTHVSGTIGANGDEAHDGVLGITPGVQLLAEKVFSDNGGGAYEDDIIAGIQHAVTMGADVINMSLGSDSGWEGEENDPVQKAIRQATEEGTLVVVAGGNAAYSTKTAIMARAKQPYASNPDLSTVGSPGVSPFALSVASYENTKIHMNTLTSTTGESLPYKNQAGKYLADVLTPGKNYDLVYIGEGRSTEYTGKDVTGKIVVTKPIPATGYSGNSSFQTEAKRRGAVAIIEVPASGVNDYPALDFSPNLLIAATTGKAEGDALISKLKSGQSVSMQLGSVGTYVDNPNKDKMSSFTSYGAPYTLDFKPEISAPGGMIYSTLPGNKYDVYSGTSMATPHVAAGSALVLQSLYNKGLTHSEDAALKAKIALMNTSKVVMDPKTNNTIPYSPRIQGSGLMQIQNAINTPVLVTRKDTPLEQAGAVALKEIKNDRAIFNLNVESLQNAKPKQELEYSVYVDLLTDGTETKQIDLDFDGNLDSKDYLTLTSKRVEGASVYVNGEKVTDTEGTALKIKSGQEKNLNVEIRLPHSLQKGAFIEGFVRLVPTGVNSDSAVPLTVPYMGYNGDWDEPNNIDPAPWSKDSFLAYTALWDDLTDTPVGYNTSNGKFEVDHMAVSPNSIVPGIFPSFTALRNLKETDLYIENQKGRRIKWLGDLSELSEDGLPLRLVKNVMSGGSTSYKLERTSIPQYTWDETNENGQLVPDGNYNYVIKTVIDYKNAKPQYVKLPIKVDSGHVKISNILVKPKDGKYEVSFNATDNPFGTGYKGAIVWVNGQYYTTKVGETSVIVPNEPKGIVVMGTDYAYNQSYAVWGDQSYNNYGMVLSTFNVSSAPVNETKPAQITVYANNRVNTKIYVKDANGKIVESMEINNEHTVRVKWTPESDVPDGTYTIYADVTTQDGFKITTPSKAVTVKR
ncbi:S8 family serine peptidase [Gottfriedia sp. NPDC057991]|uniref:S8 family serine peptidase n=1 Tax=Gottfriedia sp. NPDC057991 TaxID=3346298 RepID=UPI0036DC42D0